MSKRETVKMVKEIWKDKLGEMRSGKQMDLIEFTFQHLQKRVGIITAVVEVDSDTKIDCAFHHGLGEGGGG